MSFSCIEADGKCPCCSVTGNALGKCQFVVDNTQPGISDNPSWLSKKREEKKNTDGPLSSAPFQVPLNTNYQKYLGPWKGCLLQRAQGWGHRLWDRQEQHLEGEVEAMVTSHGGLRVSGLGASGEESWEQKHLWSSERPRRKWQKRPVDSHLERSPTKVFMVFLVAQNCNEIKSRKGCHYHQGVFLKGNFYLGPWKGFHCMISCSCHLGTLSFCVTRLGSKEWTHWPGRVDWHGHRKESGSCDPVGARRKR